VLALSSWHIYEKAQTGELNISTVRATCTKPQPCREVEHAVPSDGQGEEEPEMQK
jgi:hypothetical protein